MLSTRRQGRFRTFLQQSANWSTDSTARLPVWRHPLFGYLIGLLQVGLVLAVGVVERQLQSPFAFPGALLLFGVVLVALFWGIVPAIFTILLSLLALDYLYVPPFGTLGTYGLSGMLQLLTFVSAGIIIAFFTNRREVERVRALAAEREAVLRANQLSATFEAINDGVVVYNRRGEVLQTNAAASRIFGLDAVPLKDEAQLRQELLLQAMQHDARGQIMPEKRRPLPRLLAGEALTGRQAADILLQAPDGGKVVLNLSGAPIRGETGNVERAVIIYRDVTERHRLEQRTGEALRALLAMAEVMIQFPERLSQEEGGPGDDTARVGQRIVELTRSVVESEHVVMLAVEPQEDLARPVASVGFTPLQEEQWRERFVATPSLADQVGGPALIAQLADHEVLILEGMTLPVHTFVLPYYVRTVLVAPICVERRLVGLLCVDDGNREHTYTAQEINLTRTIAGLAALILARAQLQCDHAEARASALALQEANLRMAEFLSIICHELKNPLTVMRGSLQLAERKVKGLVSSEALLPDELRRFAPVQALLERARSQVSIQDRLVNDLLDASRIQSQKLQLQMAPCNLASIVQEAVDDQRQISPARSIYLGTPPGKNVPVSADADRLVQVVSNYLTNALKYSPPGRPVAVSLQVESQVARVSVRDEGPGLAAGECERVWERFYRVPGVEVRNGSGVGLGVGLHLCRTIIERHSGQVGVDSRPGEGSVFWFTLPLSAGQAS